MPTFAPTLAPAQESTTVVLTGTVSSSSGERLGGATVTILDGVNAGRSVSTNSNGEYRLADLTPGNGNVSAKADGYAEERRGLYIDGISSLDFTLNRLVSLSGIVESSTGKKIDRARVTVLDGPDRERSKETNENGEYEFVGLIPGNVNFSATHADYDEDRRGVFVDGTTRLNFTLTDRIPTVTITSRIVVGGPGSGQQEWEFTATGNVTFNRYDWNFGDGAAAARSGSVERHVYRTKGKYTVTVLARRPDGSWITGTLEIEVR